MRHELRAPKVDSGSPYNPVQNFYTSARWRSYRKVCRVSAGRPVLCLPNLRKSDQFIIKATEGNRELRGIAPSKSVRRRASSYVRSPLEIKNPSANSSNGKSHAISTAVNLYCNVNPAQLQFREFISRTRSRYCYLLLFVVFGRVIIVG